MKTFKALSLAMAVMALSACSQSRMGIGGRFEDIYLLQPVDLCRNMNGTQRGCFSIQVNYNDNFAYLDVVDLTQNVASQNLRILAKVEGGNYDVLVQSFQAAPGDYIQVRPLGGRHITEYTHWYIETTTVPNSGTGLVPQAANPGKGLVVVHDTVSYPDLQEVMNANNGYYTLNGN